MKLSLDEMLTDVDASQIPITEKNPLSLDRVIQKTISHCNGDSHAPIHFRRRFPFALVAAILVGLLATTALAAAFTDYHLKTVSFEYQVSEDGQILPPEVPDLGITLSVSSVSPTGLELSSVIETVKEVGTISASSDYYLQMQTDSGWLVVPMLYEHHWQWDDEKLSGEYSWNIDWTSIYGALAPGSYRIQKSFTVTSNDGAFKTYFISKEFIIGGDKRE